MDTTGSADSEEVYLAYLDLLGKLHPAGTRLDKIDDYLIGRASGMPPSLSDESRSDSWTSSGQEQEEREAIARLVDALVHFPQAGTPALQGCLPHRPYSLLTLLALLADPCLLFLLASLGVCLSDLDSPPLFNLLSLDTKRILKSIHDDQSLARPLRIPRDVRRRIREAKEKRARRDTTDQRAAAQTMKRAGSESRQGWPSDAGVGVSRTGEWIDGFFVEEYDEDRRLQPQASLPPAPSAPAPAPSTPLPPESTQTPSTKLDRLRLKRAKLASLESRSSIRLTTTPSPPPPPPPPAIPVPSTNLHPASLPPFPSVLVQNLPVEASPESLLFFFQHGSDIFKTARKINQRIDALGRNLQKYSANVRQTYGGMGQKKFGFLRAEDIVDVPCTSRPGSRAVHVHFPSPSTSLTQHDPPSSAAFISEFHNKKFFPFDPLSPRLSCSLLGPPTTTS